MQTSNIANLRRTEPSALGPSPAGGHFVAPAAYENQRLTLRSVIAILMMLSVWVSFHPFTTSQGEVSGGDIVNQLGFGSLLVLCVISLATLVERDLLLRLLKPSYFAVGAMLVLSVLISSAMGSSFRAMIFSTTVILAALTVMTLPRNIEQFAKIIALGCLISLLFSYFALYAYPLDAIHQAGGNEDQHAGLWRGVYDHKNIASAVMSVFVLIGIFVYRENQRWIGAAIVILAGVFLMQSGSKTSMALLPVAMGMTFILSRIHSPVTRFVITLLPLVILFTITVGAAVFEPVNAVLQSIAPGTTFTGRLDLWQYSVERIGEYPFLGYGFENFWGTPIVTNADQPIELTWDVRDIVHGHNSYLDATISFGIIGLAVSMLVLIIMPAADYASSNWQGPTARLANLFISIWMFTALNACLESFFFRRADPVWFCMLLAVLGLRLLSTSQAKPVR